MERHEAWAAVPQLRHGFLGAAACRGAEAWEPVLRTAGVTAPVVTLRQVHGTRVLTADVAGAGPGGRAEADGVLSAVRGLVVGVVTADCVPLLLLARRHGVVGAVHAGWRGAAGGVVEAALAHARSAFGIEPAALEACLGPAIGPCCYQVGREVRDAFVAGTGRATEDAWAADRGGFRLDLRLAVRRLLETAGVGAVASVGPCTACGPEFCSYRRDGAHAGRQLSFIGWS